MKFAERDRRAPLHFDWYRSRVTAQEYSMMGSLRQDAVRYEKQQVDEVQWLSVAWIGSH